MKLISQKEAEAHVRTGQKTFRYNRNVMLTPAGRDVLQEAGVRLVYDESTADGDSCPAQAVSTPAYAPAPVKTLTVIGNTGSKSTHEALFNSPEAELLKRQICDMGRRLWLREYVDGNGGNLSARIGPDEFICTPTGVSKGWLTPEMLCLVDGKGNQLAGTWKRTSEILTHLAIYHAVPEAKAVVHAHPVHATAFAITGFEPPGCLIPEIEVFVGRVPLAPYRTPGSPEMSEVITPLAPKHQSILMGNHGVICWGTGVEDAYFKMEITDAYCRTLVVASHIPNQGTYIPGDKMGELLAIKKKLGLPDSRFDLKAAQLCEVDPWEQMKDRPMACSNSAAPLPANTTDAEMERLVQQVTDEIFKQMQKGPAK